jgi:diguanylate cyclase (GGDEF)-like protein
MKVSGTRPQGPTKPVRVESGSASSATTKAASAGEAKPVPDVSAVSGIPESEFTPRVRDAIMRLMAEVDRLRGELQGAKKRLEELETMADQDALLPILNRRAFVREMSRIISFAERYQLPASLLYFDLDHFKEINDQHGHAAGDAVLAHVSQLLTENVRESDVIGRLGGDEFGIILAKADEGQAKGKSESLAEIITSRPTIWENKQLSVHCTHGAYTFRPGESANQAIAKADEAMYASKRGKKSK